MERARLGMQVEERSSGVIGRNSRGLLSSTIHVRGMLVDKRSGWVMGKYMGGLLSLAMLEGSSRLTMKQGEHSPH